MFAVQLAPDAVAKPKCGFGGGVPVDVLPKGMVLAGLDAVCSPRALARRLLLAPGASSDIDATGIHVIATTPESTAGTFVPGVVTPSAPQTLRATWNAAAPTIEVAFQPPDVLGVPGLTMYQLRCVPISSVRDVAAMWSSGAVDCPAVGPGVLVSEPAAESPLGITGGMVLGIFYACRVDARNSLTPRARDRPVPTCSQMVAIETAVAASAPLGLHLTRPLTSGEVSPTFGFTAPTYAGAPPATTYNVICQPSSFVGDCRNASAPGAVEGTSAAGALTVTVDGLVLGTTYSCSAVSQNDAGLSECSAPVTVTPYALNQPTGLSAPFPLVSGATFTYSAPANLGTPQLTGYKVYCQTSADPSSCQNSTAPGVVTGVSTGLTLTVAGLSLGTTYTCWAVSTIHRANALGESACSTSVEVTPFVLYPPTIELASSFTGTCDQELTFRVTPDARPSIPRVDQAAVYCGLAGYGISLTDNYPSATPVSQWAFGPIVNGRDPTNCNAFNKNAKGVRFNIDPSTGNGRTDPFVTTRAVTVSGLLPKHRLAGRGADYTNNYYHYCWGVALMYNVTRTADPSQNAQGSSPCSTPPAVIQTPYYANGFKDGTPLTSGAYILCSQQANFPVWSTSDGRCRFDSDCASQYCQYSQSVACNDNPLRTRCWTRQPAGYNQCVCDTDCANGNCHGNLNGLQSGVCN